MARVGILGGTFDPIHNGHLQLAHTALEMCTLARIVFIPAFHPPHKSIQQLTPFSHRVAMLKLATENVAKFSISTMEENLPAPTYTYDMMRAFLAQQHVDSEFFFIIGIDAFLEIRSWKAYREVLSSMNFIIFPREGYSAAELDQLLQSLGYIGMGEFWESGASRFQIFYLSCNIINVSSSMIRENIAGDQLEKEILADSVKKYIYSNNLYRPNKKRNS